jgi:hypothetical protein
MHTELQFYRHLHKKNVRINHPYVFYFTLMVCSALLVFYPRSLVGHFEQTSVDWFFPDYVHCGLYYFALLIASNDLPPSSIFYDFYSVLFLCILGLAKFRILPWQSVQDAINLTNNLVV